LGAGATIAAAFIAKEDTKRQPPVPLQMAGIEACMHEEGVIISDPLKVVGPAGYKETFENGELHLPACEKESRFAIYSGNGPRKLLGTFVWPGYTPRRAFMIHIEQKTECWEPVVFPVKID
jgi:hypothetical protein